jgi:hypothetical protein
MMVDLPEYGLSRRLKKGKMHTEPVKQERAYPWRLHIVESASVDKFFRQMKRELSVALVKTTTLDKNGVTNLFSFCADACGESNEIVSMEKVPGTCFESMSLLVQEPIGW